MIKVYIVCHSASILKTLFIITKTCLYNVDPLKPHFYIVKLGFTGVHRGTAYKYEKFSSESFHFLVVKFTIHLNRRVFVMSSTQVSLCRPSLWSHSFFTLSSWLFVRLFVLSLFAGLFVMSFFCLCMFVSFVFVSLSVCLSACLSVCLFLPFQQKLSPSYLLSILAALKQIFFLLSTLKEVFINMDKTSALSVHYIDMA